MNAKAKLLIVMEHFYMIAMGALYGKINTEN